LQENLEAKNIVCVSTKEGQSGGTEKHYKLTNQRMITHFLQSAYITLITYVNLTHPSLGFSVLTCVFDFRNVVWLHHSMFANMLVHPSLMR